MNKKQLQRIRNDNYRLVDSSKSLAGESRYGIVRINTNNSLKHEQKKLEICYCLKKRNHQFLTECRFKAGGRADVFDLDRSEAYEVVVSESEDSIKSKRDKYPVPVIVVEVD